MGSALSVQQQVQPRIRVRLPSDYAWIHATWKSVFWKTSPFAARIKANVYFPAQDKIIERLLARSRVLVACDPLSEEDTAGYIVYEPHAVHFTYVKEVFRRAGIARALLAASELPADLAGVKITHATYAWLTTKHGGPGIEEKFPAATHDPYLAFEERQS